MCGHDRHVERKLLRPEAKIYTKKTWCSKFKEKNMGHTHVLIKLAPAKRQNAWSVLK